MIILLAADTIRWTDILTAIATAGQFVFVAGGIVVGLCQLKQTKDSEIAKATDKVNKQLTSKVVTAAIERISQCEDPQEDQQRIREVFQKPSDDTDRIAQEKAISLLTNVFEHIYEKYNFRLISRERYLNSNDEITLFVCISLLKAHEVYDYPDYEPLFSLARRCQENYIQAHGANKFLKTHKIPYQNPARFKTSKILASEKPSH